MRPRLLVAFGIATGVACLGGAAAQAEESYHHGRLRYADPGVTVQRASDTGAEEAVVNDPFLPGDRVWTDENGRADFQFTDGSAVRLDRRSKLDYAGHEEDREERVTLRLWSGSLMVRVRPRSEARIVVETPGGAVLPAGGSVVRVDVDAGEARVSVYQGEAVLDDGRDRLRLSAGERTFARGGSRAEEAERFDADEQDDFAQWEQDREGEERRASESTRYLPGELATYSDEFDRYGDWRYEPSEGYVWVPQVEVGWRPYWNGHWAWTPYGWTWVPYERWGWAPCHYGRWGYSVSLGWYWLPGRTWGPAWVSWGMGGGYVGWCPLGRHDRPVTAWGGGRYDDFGRGNHAVLRGGFGPRVDGWTVVRQGQLGAHNIARVRVPNNRIDSNVLRVADTVRLQPARDASHLQEANAVPRAIRTRPMPGDFVRELAVDNRTTIPSPWFRRGDSARPRGEPTGDSGEPRNPGGAGGRGEARPTPHPGNGEVTNGATHNRPVPWFRPTENTAGSTANERNGAVDRGGSAGRGNGSGERGGVSENDGASRRREAVPRLPASNADDRGRRESSPPPVYRPRHDDQGEPRSGGAYRPQNDAHRERSSGDSGNARPRGESHSGGGEARPSGGSSRGESHSSSGSKSSANSSDSKSSAERAAPRPHNR